MADRIGDTFQVNTTSEGIQFFPEVAGLSDGGFVVVWADGSPDPANINVDVRGQIFNADGTARGSEFLVNTTTEDAQELPSVVGLSDGGFVVAWEDESETGGDTERAAIRATVYDADGTARGGEILVNSTTKSSQGEPSVASLSGGGFVVTWDDVSRSDDAPASVIRGQVFTADGTLQGGEFLVNTITDGGGILPSAAGLSDGGFVVTWRDSRGTGGDTNASAVRGQVFNADGSQRGGEFLANTTTKFAQTTPDVAALADGGFVVTWTDGSATGGDQDATAIRGQVYAADGSPEGGEFLVNTTTRDSQEIPSVTGLPDNGFVVTWEDRTVFTDNIGGQYFDADRTPRGEEFILTSEDANGRVPSVADFSNGHLVVVWANRTDTSGIDVVGQVFEAPEPEFTLTSADIADQVSATYLGYYGRAPEPAGFRFWQDEHDRLAATGRTDIDVLVNFASRFAEVEESLANLPFLANPTAERADAFVNNVYQQLFNRDAEAAGEDFFSDKLVDQLAAGQPIGDTVLSIMTGARNEDAATLQKKLAVATAFAETLSQAEFDALSDSVLTAREVVADVTADTATRDAALAEIETLTTTGVSTSDGVFG